jgi:ankyrin repeat protein
VIWLINLCLLLQLLTSYGCNVDDTFGSLNTTALMVASFHGHSKIVQYLLEEGANVNLVDSQGSTTLGYAFGGKSV